MPTLRLLAVEDDTMQARLLRHQVLQLGYELVGVAATATEAQTMFREQKPDILLLDIHIKGDVDGVELALLLLRQRAVPLIFLTSDDRRSTYERALTAGPFAFLTKPYDESHLARALELAVAHFARSVGGTTATMADGSAMVPDAFYVRQNYQLVKVYYDDVLWMESDDVYVSIHTVSHKYAVRTSLRQLEEKLPSGRFVRVRRNALVQLAAIDQIDLRANLVRLRGVEVPVGGTYRDELLKYLQRFD
jgi:DNA-binding LytR/AlgR family response regulator